MDANEQRVDAESEDHETEQMDQPWRVKIIALSGTVVEEVEVAEICTASVGLVALLAPRAAAKMRVDVSRLRFSLSGRVLDIWDTWHELGEPRELQLVVLPFCNDFKDELLEAVSGQDLDQVNQVLGRLQDPNARSRDHVSAFMKASILGQPEIMVVLYGAGADVDAEDLAGLTALHCAVRDARLETVRLLLNLRSNVDARNKLGRTPLFEAVSTGCVAMVQALATAAADPDSADRDGGTPLRAAVAAGFLEAVEILVNAGATVDLPGHDGSGVLHVAAGHDRHELVRTLLQRSAKMSQSNQQGATALHVAARNGQCEVLRTLLDAKADQQPDAHGVTPLCAAAAAKPWLLTMSQGAGPGPSGSPKQYQVRRSGNNLKAVRLLLLARGAPQEADLKGTTPLHAAVEAGRLEIVRLLLEHLAPVDPCDQDGMTPLLAAAQLGHPDIASTLLAAGANWGAKCDSEASAMHAAASRGFDEVVRVLIEARADVNHVDETGATPLAALLAKKSFAEPTSSRQSSKISKSDVAATLSALLEAGAIH